VHLNIAGLHLDLLEISLVSKDMLHRNFWHYLGPGLRLDGPVTFLRCLEQRRLGGRSWSICKKMRSFRECGLPSLVLRRAKLGIVRQLASSNINREV